MAIFNLFKGEAPPLVERAFQDVKSMLATGYEMFTASTGVLLDNEILEIDLQQLDARINQCERNLRRSTLEHLSIDPGSELIFSLKLISIVNEAERIGDLCKSLSKVAGLAKKPRVGPYVEPLREVRDKILGMFERGNQGFISEDVSAARELMRTHEQVKNDIAAYLVKLADEENITPNESMVFAMSARILSRISSHLANIASTVALPFDQMRHAPS